MSNEIRTYTKTTGFPDGFDGDCGEVWLDIGELDRAEIAIPKKLNTKVAEVISLQIRNNHVLNVTYALPYGSRDSLLLTVAPNETNTGFIVISAKVQTNLHRGTR